VFPLRLIADGAFNPLERIAQGKLAGEIHDGEAGLLTADIIEYNRGCDSPSFGIMPTRCA
jgi:hypothetical protein